MPEEPSLEIIRRHQPSAKGIDLYSFEKIMDSRLRMIWLRHPVAVAIGGLILAAATLGGVIYLTFEPTVMRIAVGPDGSPDVTFVQTLAEKLKADSTSIRLAPEIHKAPVSVKDIHGKPDFDLAVVRGNMALSQDWPVVAILRKDVAALFVPATAAQGPLKDQKGKPKKRAKIEKVADLAGHTVGIVAGTDGGPELLDLILKHYGVPQDKVKVETVGPNDLKSAIHDNKIDVVLVAGPETGTIISDAVTAASHGKDGPTFVEINQAEGIGKRVPPYESMDIPAGTFGGMPPQPDDSLTTLSYPIYIVARKTFNDDKVAAFSKALYLSRQSIASEMPGIVAIEAPSTDKDAAVLVHNGTASYLGDNQKTFFDKYGDLIFYAMLIIPAVGSMLAGAFGYLNSTRNTRRMRQLYRLLRVIKIARKVDAIGDLEQLQDEADTILGETLNDAERGQLGDEGMASFALAIEQARLAISEQRALLVMRGEKGLRATSP